LGFASGASSSATYHDGSSNERLLQRLPRNYRDVTVLTMYILGRSLQVVGLIIPPLAIMAELNERNPSQMLKFLAIAIGIFVLGYLLQRYSGGGAT
jgi:hypothetical protein